MNPGSIYKISGALVLAHGLKEAVLNETVEIGELKIPGEIIRIDRDTCYIQSYEETAGLLVGESVVLKGEPLSVVLGPGLLGTIFDGIQRPLNKLKELSGDFIKRGCIVEPLDMEKKWNFNPVKQPGDVVKEGDIIGIVKEGAYFEHRIMVPIGISGTIEEIQKGDFSLKETVARLTGGIDLTMTWTAAVKTPIPCVEKLDPDNPFLTGQRVLDFLFPLATGGSAMIPGGFGTGKTVLEQSIAKYSLADVIIYVGCGERGNEMTDLLEEFSELKDPRTGNPLMDRTVLIANTSNMPVAAREASIYTGVTIAEYFRQMGYDTALIADSTTRWAEALREISGRLEELPGEEGFPTYLSSRITSFYERSGYIRCFSSEERFGSLTIIGAVSPAGGDFSEPVTSETLKVTGTFWGLEKELAYRRHYPAINWNTSYSLYSQLLDGWYKKKYGIEFINLRKWAINILFSDGQLQQIVQLVGPDSLQDDDRLILETANLIKESFLQQSAFDESDAYCTLIRQYIMMSAIKKFFETANKIVKEKKSFSEVSDLKERKLILELKEHSDDEILEKFDLNLDKDED